MKLGYVLILFIISTACSAADLHINKMNSSAYLVMQNAVMQNAVMQNVAVKNAVVKNAAKQTSIASQLVQAKPIAFSAFDILGSDTSNTLVIGSLSLGDMDIFNHYSSISNQSGLANDSHFGYFTEFQLTLKSDLSLTGQWTRLHDSYNHGYTASQILRPVEWSLATESRTSTAREIGLNWAVYEGLHAFAKLQTVNGSAWIPLVTVPRFVTQDSENWTLAAVELVYRF